jgi:hypothetical protein
MDSLTIVLGHKNRGLGFEGQRIIKPFNSNKLKPVQRQDSRQAWQVGRQFKRACLASIEMAGSLC